MRYLTCKYTVTLKPGLGVTQGHRNLYHSIRHHDFLLTFHSNHPPISHRIRDKRQYPSKIARKLPIFSIPVYLTPPLKGFPLDLCIAQRSQETRMMGLSDGQKSFQIGLTILIQYRQVMDTQPATQTGCRSKETAYYVARVNTQTSRHCCHKLVD